MRLISRLDIKYPNLIKGIHLEGLKVIGDPIKFANKYYQQGADELLIIDSVASLYDREPCYELLGKMTKNVFCPITIGGGIKDLETALKILNCGADKVSINTSAVRNPMIIKKISNIIGAQSVVISIEAKKRSKNSWEVFIENGREPTKINVVDWVKKVNQFGCGEILLTSIDLEGTRMGFDYNLYNIVSKISKCPIIASGGAGSHKHIGRVLKETRCSAVAVADLLHIQNQSIDKIKKKLRLK
jgi:imidazole glycerol-phosphate synthase subunit HisF